MPAECCKLFRNRFWRANFRKLSINLQAIIVYDCQQVVQMIMRCKHRCFPDLTFFNFAIAQNGINLISSVVQLASQSHTTGNGNALSERTAGHINARCMNARVTLQHCTDVPQRLQFFLWEETTLCQCCIQCRCTVSLRKYQPIPICHFRLFRINVHFCKIKIRQQVADGKRTARMSGLCTISAFNDTHPHFTSNRL